MARSIWSGTIGFGLVSIPVRLFSAVQQKDVRFNQFEGETGKRIRYKRVAEGTDREVEYEDIVKGYEVDDGRFVMIEPEELEELEPERSRTIAIEDFVDLDEIDPIYFERTYYVAPQEDAGAQQPYALLLQAMQQRNKVGIGSFVMRGKQYLAVIRPMQDGVLALETMYLPDEVRALEEIDTLPAQVDVDERHTGMALQLIESLSSPWQPEKYRDTYRERVLEFIDRKAEGEEFVVEEAPEPAKVADLMEALKRSVAEASGRAAPAASGDDLEELSVKELEARARQLEIPGRSKMNRDELRDALREAS
jgi:DNA end-binding protein Ku